MPKINLSEMADGTKFADIDQTTKDMWTREAATEIETSDNYGNTHYYSSCGNYLVFAVKDKDGYIQVYETKIVRKATFAPNGELI
jgi:hypothetical protein